MGWAEDYLKEKITSRYTITQFAEKSGLPRSSIYNWMANVDSIPVGTFRILMKALELDPNELLRVDWNCREHFMQLSEDEYRLLDKYRNDPIMHGVIDKLTK